MFDFLTLRRPTHTTVVAYLALFFALGGGAAMAANEFTGANIEDGTLASRDLKDNAGAKSADVVNDSVSGGGLTASDIRNDNQSGGGLGSLDIRSNSLTSADVRALTGADVTDGALKGADVDEASFGTVPTAQSASTVAGDSIGSAQVAADSLTGEDIDESSLSGTSVGGLQVIEQQSASDATDFKNFSGANCPSGKKAIGGGATVLGAGSTPTIAIRTSRPSGSAFDPLLGWFAEAYETAPVSLGWSIKLYSICAPAS